MLNHHSNHNSRSTTFIIGTFLVLYSSTQLQNIESFVLNNQNNLKLARIQSQSQPQLNALSYNDFEEYNDFTSSSNNKNDKSNSNNKSTEDEDIFAALHKRKEYLSSFGKSSSAVDGTVGISEEEESKLRSNWKYAQCSSTIRLSLDDWVRRVAIDTYPLGVCGSANGSIYLLDLERGETLDCAANIHDAQINDEDVEEAMNKMYGKFDGGGVLSLAIKDDIIVSSGREGGLQVFKIDGEEVSYYKGSRGGTAKSTKLKLKCEGMLFYLVSTLVTSLAFDSSGYLWVGSYDGYVRAFEYDDREKSLVQQEEPIIEFDVGSQVLSVSVNDDIGCGVAATTSGEVILFSLEEGEILGKWKAFGRNVGRKKREFARTAIIIQNDEASGSNDAVWSIIAGGSGGSLFQHRLNMDSMGYISDSNPLADDPSLLGRFRPNHTLSVVSLSSPFPGILVSGSQDGHIRVWDCSYYKQDDDESAILQGFNDDDGQEEAQFDDVGGLDNRPQCLYALTGFKVWLGSVFTNQNKMVSDGADNAIVVHNFSGDDDNIEDYLFEDDDLEDFLD